MKRRTLLIGGVLALGAVGYLLMPSSHPTPHITVQTPINTKKPVTTPNPTPATQPSPNIQSTPPHYFIKAQQEIHDAFEPIDIETMQQKRPHTKIVEPKGAFTLTPGTISKLFPGDTLQLYAIDGNDYELSIEKRRRSKRGTVMLAASIVGEERMTRTVLTENKQALFITLHAPEGTYEFEAVDGEGYFYLASDMRKATIDYSKTDAIMPPHDEAHETH